MIKFRSSTFQLMSGFKVFLRRFCCRSFHVNFFSFSFFSVCTVRSETSNVSACSSTADQGIGGTASRNFLNKSGVSDHVQRYYCDEKRMIMAFQSFVRSHDPDMLIGYEIQMTSWGYLMDRAKQLDIILCPLLSRIPSATEVSRSSDDSEKEALLYGHMNEFKITGRILLNVWRIMRSEVFNLSLYGKVIVF